MTTLYTIQIQVDDSDTITDEEKVKMIGKALAEGSELNADDETQRNMKIVSVTATLPKTIEINTASEESDTLDF